MRTMLKRILGGTIWAVIGLAVLWAIFLRDCGGNNPPQPKKDTPATETPAVSGTESQELKELRETVKKLKAQLTEKPAPATEQKESLADRMLTNLLKRGGSISKDGVETKNGTSSEGRVLTEEQERLKRLAKEAKANARNAELSFGIDSYTARVARQKAAEAELIAEEAAAGDN